MRLRTSEPRRWAFTLIEMLVVVALMLILMTIAAAMFPRFAENQRIIKGADQISTMLVNARMRAQRDRASTGVRIEFDPSTGQARQLTFVQRIDDFAKQGTAFLGMDGSPLRAKFFPDQPPASPFFFDSSYYTTQLDLAPVQFGDYLEVNGGGLVMRIEGVVNDGRGNKLMLAAPGLPTNLQTDLRRPYRIIRQPRPVTGEPPVELPQNIVIENEPLSQSIPKRPVIKMANQPPFPYAEIMFAPGGGVDGRGTSTSGNIILWVRDVSKGTPLEGSPLLVSIHTRTGMIAVHPVNTAPGGDPYQFTKDGRSSGL